MATTSTVHRILDAALELFNERGVGSVSTRTIAERAGVSSGNLHYHFANKEAIVRALLTRRYELGDRMWVFPDSIPSMAALRTLLLRNLEITWEYRFLNRELVSLTIGDPGFSEYYAKRYRERMDELRLLVVALVESGQLALEPDAFERTITIGWIISENWLAHLETIGADIDRIRFEEGVDLILEALGSRRSSIA